MSGWWAAEGAAWSTPWWLMLLLGAWRWRGSPSLEEHPAEVAPPVPPVSVIVPARNEAGHIADCTRAVLRTSYPQLELIVVDDHSTDGTAALARAAAGDDPRLTVLSPPPLPAGWLGKQWACHHGAQVARGTYLLFTDADVRLAPDLPGRLVNASRAHEAALTSVAGFQETRTFWERVVQPFVFTILAQWFGGPGEANRARAPHRKIANGQCLFFERAAYDRFGGHEAVRFRAAEDLAFAQELTAAGERVHLTMGERQLSTRMYGSLGEIIAGWSKNVYSAGRETVPGGGLGRAVARVLVPGPAVLALLPVVGLVLGASGIASPAWRSFGASATLALLLLFLAVGRAFRLAPWYALTFPLAALVYLYIALVAVWRGDRVRWKEREYDVGA